MSRLSIKIIIAFVVIGLTATLAAGWIGFGGTKRALEKEAFEKLTVGRENKKREIERHIKSIRGQIRTLSADHMVIKALSEFSSSFSDLQTSEQQDILPAVQDLYETQYLKRFSELSVVPPQINRILPSTRVARYRQYEYIAQNPFPVGEKDRFHGPQSPSSYARYHALYHPVLRDYLNTFGFYDIFLIDTQGNVVYSVFKEMDFATNLVSGPHRNSGLASVHKSLVGAADPNAEKLVDFSPYLPSYNAPASFVGSPVFDGDEQIGSLVFQISIDEIDSIMTGNRNWRHDGLGVSGETYLVGSDLRMRNNSRFLLQDKQTFMQQLRELDTDSQTLRSIQDYSTSVLFLRVDTIASRGALAGDEDTRIIDDYRGVPVLSAFAPVDFGGLSWGILSEIDYAEILEPISLVREQLIYLTIAISSIVIALGVLFARRITAPLEELARTTHIFRLGDFKKRVEVTSQDEIGSLATSFNEMAEVLNATTVSKSYLDKILNSMNEALFVLQVDESGESLIVENINPAAAHILGYDNDDIVGSPIDRFIDGEVLSKEEWYKLMREGSMPSLDRNLVAETGRKIPVIFSLSIMEDEAGRKSEVVCVCVIQDITERKKAEKKLQLAGVVYQSAAEAIMVVDATHQITEVNPAFEQITGYSRKEVLGKHPRMLESSQNTYAFYDVMLEKVSQDRYWRGEFSGQRKHGTLLPLIVSVTALLDEDGGVCRFVFIMSDVSELKEREARTWAMANYDMVTNLPNRNLFGDRLEQSLNNAQRNDQLLALLFIDLDGFKLVNDNFGHAVGDVLLKRAGNRLQKALRDLDSLARIGGDEFTAILTDIQNHENAQIVAAKLVEVMHQPFDIEGESIQVSVSIGVAFFPEQAENSKDLIRMADFAMYAAKASGKDRYLIFDGKQVI